ncbi:helix-turn-helix domain-containing protein [Bordetella petrii]|uniref:helix-turn-helix domain-containing protein n=1 Tax=Bordetella petrii TaxID=94624 RepID=UPI0038B349FE
MKTFSDRLKYARTLRHHTQESLARACGLSQSSIAGYESGQRRSSRSSRKIASVLRIELDWLETGKGPMEKREAYSLPGAPGPHVLTEPAAPAGPAGTPAPWPFPTVPPSLIQTLSTSDRNEVDKWLRMIVDGYLRGYADTKGRKRRGGA